jgi:hypothetical protein
LDQKVSNVITQQASLAFRGRTVQNTRMDSSAAISSAVAGISAGGTSGAVAVSVLKSTESAEAQQMATLFSSIGIGGNVSAYA